MKNPTQKTYGSSYNLPAKYSALVIVILFSELLSFRLSAQPCDLNSAIDSVYSFDASMLALREMNSGTDSVWSDSVSIPDSLIDKYLELISTVYLLNTGTTDTIFNHYQIHVFPDIPYQHLSMRVDGSYGWIKVFLQDSVSSGNAVFDSIIHLYDFKLEYYYSFATSDAMTIKTNRTLNVKALENTFEKIDGLSDVYAPSIAGDGDNIETDLRNDTAFMVFSKGWGDCPAGCINKQYWEFTVTDCQAQFDRSYGDHFTSMLQMISGNEYFVPNPFSEMVYYTGVTGKQTIVRIYSVTGRQIGSFELTDESKDLSFLDPGIYLLKWMQGNSVYVTKMVKL